MYVAVTVAGCEPRLRSGRLHPGLALARMARMHHPKIQSRKRIMAIAFFTVAYWCAAALLPIVCAGIAKFGTMRTPPREGILFICFHGGVCSQKSKHSLQADGILVLTRTG